MKYININFKLRTLIIINSCLLVVELLLVSVFSVSFLFKSTELKQQVYEIPSGVSLKDVADDLERRGLIYSSAFFNLYARLKRVDTKLQAGRYTFPKTRMNLVELANFLTSGARAREIEFTIPEGYTSEQIADLLAVKGLVRDSFLQSVRENYLAHAEGFDLVSPRNKYFSFLDSKFRDFKIGEKEKIIVSAENSNKNLEGYLFPDTYRVYQDATIEEIIEKMLNNFDRKLTPDLRQEIERQGRTFNEVVIMASILEKEVRTEEDMRKVADILWRRLKGETPLEVDSTLNYILQGKNPSLTYDELQIDSPYNTYKYKGLPPTAISNPGLKAIKAAISPLKNYYWFYLSKPDGETVFAKTLKEQVRNKARYWR